MREAEGVVGILERQGLFSGLLFCADCGGKLHFATCKSYEDGRQDHYVCNQYKSGRGTCSAHYIREDVLREIVLERIRAVNAYIRRDVEGFQEEWLQCRRSDQERSIREDRKRIAQAKKRLTDLEVPELTPTIVNEYIKKIEVFAPDKSSGKRMQRVKIYFNFVDDVDIPVISEPIVSETTYGRRKTA